MVTYKEISLEDLKKDYSDRKGFVFKSDIPSSDTSVEKLCKVLINEQITNSFPEFVARPDDKTCVFVYDKDFDMPYFLQRSDAICRVFLRGTKVDSLHNFLIN